MRKAVIVISLLDIWSMGKNEGAQSLWLTLKGYADEGFDTYFITVNKKNIHYQVSYKNLKIIRFGSDWACHLIKIKKIGFFARTLFWFYFQVRAILYGHKIAKKYKNIIFYGYETDGVPAAKVLSIIHKSPVVSRFQGTILMPKTNLPFWKLRYWQHVFAMRIPVDLLIMTNDGTQGNKVLKLLGVNMNRVKFWMNGVKKDIMGVGFNENNFKMEIGIPLDNRIILTVSRLVRWKRLDRVINALSEVLKYDRKVVLMIIGDGEEKNKLEYIVKELDIEGNVIFIGGIPHEKIARFYKIADIFVSLYDLSNVGNPLLEAMAYGKCIITLNNGDTSQFIQNNINGILIDPNQLRQIPQVILDLLKDDEKRKLLGKHARYFALEKFWTWEERIKIEVNAVEKLMY